MRILEGVGTFLQLSGLMARLCKLVSSCLSASSFANCYPEHEAGVIQAPIDTVLLSCCFAIPFAVSVAFRPLFATIAPSADAVRTISSSVSSALGDQAPSAIFMSTPHHPSHAFTFFLPLHRWPRP